jgi:outer membrane protein insertion porin family
VKLRTQFGLRGIVACFLLAAAAAPGQNYEGRTVSAVRFLPAEQTLPAEELAGLLTVKPGEKFSGLALRESLRKLFATGRFVNLEADLTAEGEDVVLTFITTPNRFIGNVSLQGNPGAVSRGELVNAAKLPLGAAFEESLLNQSVESIEDELRLDGFYESKVTYTLDRDLAHSQVNINFRVEPGPRARFTTPTLKGNLALPGDRLVKAAGWRRFYGLGGWKYVREQTVQSGLRSILNLYRKNEYLMAKAQLERLDYQPAERVAIPSLRLEAGPRVQLRATGVKLSRNQMRKLVPIYEEQSVDKDLLMEGNRKISAFLRGKGFFDAKVRYELEQEDQVVAEIDPAKDAVIDYEVERGPRYRVSAIFLNGNSYFDNATLLERMAVKAATPLRYRQGRYSDELLNGDKFAIEDLYRSNGFLDVKVSTSVTRRYRNQPDKVAIRVDISEGKQTLIESLRFEGIADSDRAVLEGFASASPGQPYSIFTINTDRDRILGLLYQNGYSESVFEALTEPGSQPGAIKLIYRIQGGRQHFVREVVITGLKSTNPSLVDKRIRLAPGAPLNNAEVYASQRRLYDLGIFARVDTAQQNPEGDEVSKTILFNVEEASRISFNGGIGAEVARIGGGITSLDSPAGGAGFSPRISLGVNRTNFLGLGHTVGVQTRLSNIQRRILLTYLAPQFRDSDRFSLTTTALYDDARNVRTFNSKRLEASMQLAQRLSLANSIQYRLTFRRVTIDQETIKIDPSLIPLLAQPVRVGSFSSTFIQDRRDDPVDAKRGRYTTVDVGLATRAFASSTNFARLLARNSSYYKIGKDLVFARSLNIGVLTPYAVREGLDTQTDIPLPERFFGGGAYSHRGFPENQAGPRDLVTGFPIGGKAILVNNLELRFPLIGDNLGGVFFHDAGNVYSDIKKVSLRWNQRDLKDFDYMVHALGFGFRYRTPIGPVRIDLAFTPNAPRFNGFEGSREDLLFGRGRQNQLRVNQFQFHISLGQAF